MVIVVFGEIGRSVSNHADEIAKRILVLRFRPTHDLLGGLAEQLRHGDAAVPSRPP